MASYKSQATAYLLADELTKSMAPLAVTTGADANGYVTILVGAGTAGSKSVFIRVQEVSLPLAVNVVGSQAEVFVPTAIQFATEANPSSGAGADILGPNELLPLLTSIVNVGARIDWFVSANGTAPSVTILNTAADLQKSWYTSLYGSVRSSA